MKVEMRRSVIMNCVRDDSDLPAAYRWLYKNHVADSISQFAPYVSKYSTYRALPIPPAGIDFGTYNWIMTEHYWLINPMENAKNNLPRGLAFTEYWPPEFLEITNQPPHNSLRDKKWAGTKDGYHPIVFAFLPLFWEADLKGSDRTIEDGPNYRWQIVVKYPEGVTREEGDRWFLGEFASGMAERPEVTRVISSRVLDEPRTGPFQRVAEIWFESSRDWEKAVEGCRDKIAKPAWSSYGSFPYLEPYNDFVGIFLLDRPESDHLNQYKGYVTTR